VGRVGGKAGGGIGGGGREGVAGEGKRGGGGQRPAETIARCPLDRVSLDFRTPLFRNTIWKGQVGSKQSSVGGSRNRRALLDFTGGKMGDRLVVAPLGGGGNLQPTGGGDRRQTSGPPWV